MPDNEVMTAPHSPGLSLRERKKIKTRTAIRSAMYALVEEQGYDATTIEQIAERAEVSPSTVFRYFPTKEDIVLTDEYDAILLEELRGRPRDEPWPVSLRYVLGKAMRVGIEEDPRDSRVRARLMAKVPAVRSRMTESMAVTSQMFREGVAARTGLDADSFEVHVYARSVVGGLLEVTLHWAENDFQDDVFELLDRALDVLEHGLTGLTAREETPQTP